MATKKLIYNIDLCQSELQNAVLQPVATLPATGKLGQIIFNSTDKMIYSHDGTAWKPVGVVVTYDLLLDAVSSNAIPIKLVGSNGTTDTIYVKGAGGATITKDGSNIVITTANDNTTYSFSGATSGKNYVITITPSTGSPQTVTVPLDYVTPTELETAINNVQANIDTINAKIPTGASSSNKLVTQTEMGDAIASVEAKQIYKTAQQGSFATKAELTAATTFYNADGTVATPTKNDVAYVLADESHDGKAAKYVIASISGSTITWGFVIAFSNMTFSQAQMDAINSGITSSDVSYIEGLPDELDAKVDKVAGKGLSTNDYDNTEKAKVADSAKIKVATGTLTAGQTSVNVACVGTILSVITTDASTGEEVGCGIKHTSTGITVSISQAYANNISIVVNYKTA